MTTEPDQRDEDEVTPEAEVDTTVVGDSTEPRIPVADELSRINSIDEVKEIFIDGVDRLRGAVKRQARAEVGEGTEPFKAAAKTLFNSGISRWRKFLDDVEGKVS